MRVAIVHDWLYVLGGAERVLREFLRCYPEADVFTLFDTLTSAQRAWIGYDKARTSFLQRVPGIAGMHRNLLPLMPYAIEQFDFSDYDLVISSSFAVAKGVITGPDQVHIAYVHSPMRYAWDMQHHYLRESGGTFGIKGALARILLQRVRIWDSSSGLRANAIAANSGYIARRIKKAFGRNAQVIYPPVDVTRAGAGLSRKDHFLAAGRLVAYKNIKAIIEAFRFLPELELVIAGTGPEEKKLRAIAGPNVTFAGFVNNDEMRRLMATARALIYAAEEDFGIIPVEAQAEGTPVIALRRGGTRETIIEDGPLKTGIFFEDPAPPTIAACVNLFLANSPGFSPEACQNNAHRFSPERFRSRFKSFVSKEIESLAIEIKASCPTGEAVRYAAAE